MKIRFSIGAIVVLASTISAVRGAILESPRGNAVVFDYVPNSSLIVVPVMINSHGPFRFLLDTGATKTIVSARLADKLGIPKGRIEMLLSAGGNLPVTARTLRKLDVGNNRLENVEVVAGDLPLMKTLKVDGLLGGDYLRRFKISIDYDNRMVELQPCCDSLSLLT